MMPNTPIYTGHAALPGIETARSNQHFMVPFEGIKANDWDLSVNRYKEVEYEEVEYAAPSIVMDEIKSLDDERTELLTQLKQMIKHG